MIQILHLIFNSKGAMICNDTLPLVFENRSEAVAFLGRYLLDTFARGKSGYRRDDDYWWACNDEPTLEIHRYAIKGRLGYEVPRSSCATSDSPAQ